MQARYRSRKTDKSSLIIPIFPEISDSALITETLFGIFCPFGQESSSPLLGNRGRRNQANDRIYVPSGWRKGEIVKLEVADVDDRARVIRLQSKNSNNKGCACCSSEEGNPLGTSVRHGMQRTRKATLKDFWLMICVGAPMGITAHKTRSSYRRYRIVDERDLREATESLQAYLKTQTLVVVPIKKSVW